MTPTQRPTSVFGEKSLHQVYKEICDAYLRFPQPWVIGYSGGKDSTTVLQLVWNALRSLPRKYSGITIPMYNETGRSFMTVIARYGTDLMLPDSVRDATV